MWPFVYKKFTGVCALFIALVLLLCAPLQAAAAPTPPSSSVNSYLLSDAATGEIIAANKPNERIYPASTTKMMTALLLLETKSDLTQKVTCGTEVNGFGADASMMGLKQYETVSYRDLLYGMMLASGNDAAATVAVSLGGSFSGFADMMNAKAKALGMTGTHFVNPHGMHHEDHYTTAADLSLLAIACMKNATFAEVVATRQFTTSATNKAPGGHALTNTNRLLSNDPANAAYRYAPAIGIKTGSTNAAQGCLVSAAQKDGRTLICVMMGDNSSGNGIKYPKRWTDSVAFYNYGFSLTRVDLGTLLASLPLKATVPGANAPSSVTAALPESLGYWTDADTAAAISAPGAITVTYEYAADFPVFAPFNQPLATAVFQFNGETICTAPVSLQIATNPADDTPQRSPLPRWMSIAIWAAVFLFCVMMLIVVLRMPALRRKQKPAPRNGRGGQPQRPTGNKARSTAPPRRPPVSAPQTRQRRPEDRQYPEDRPQRSQYADNRPTRARRPEVETRPSRPQRTPQAQRPRYEDNVRPLPQRRTQSQSQSQSYPFWDDDDE